MEVKIKENEVVNDLLGYEGLKIIQEPGRFNFSLDSTLLAHFVKINNHSKKIADFCTGNAPIPLMLTLRTTSEISGIELQFDSADQATRSVLLNNLSSQITILNENLINIHESIGTEIFDVITCNPPFFKVGPNSNLNKNDALTMARHEVTVTLEDIVKEAAILLKPGGNFAMVHRPDRFLEIIETLQKYKLTPKRVRFVYPRIDKEANGVLIEATLHGKIGGMRLEAPLIIYEESTPNYTKEILEMFNLKKKFD